LVIFRLTLTLESSVMVLLVPLPKSVTGTRSHEPRTLQHFCPLITTHVNNDNGPLPFNVCRRPCIHPFSETKNGIVPIITQLGLWRKPSACSARHEGLQQEVRTEAHIFDRSRSSCCLFTVDPFQACHGKDATEPARSSYDGPPPYSSPSSCESLMSTSSSRSAAGETMPQPQQQQAHCRNQRSSPAGPVEASRWSSRGVVPVAASNLHHLSIPAVG
jgi:hypothetical protein